MKKVSLIIMGIAALVFAACNDGGSASSEKKDTTAMGNMSMDSGNTAMTEKTDAPVIKASFANVNADLSAHMKELTSHYFHIKYALSKDDATEAKKGATMLLQVASQFDKSLIPADQKKEYDQHIVLIEKQAQALNGSTDIEAARSHFAELSAHVYELVKAFGAGKKVYYDHCPMAFDSKGANWLNDNASIQNPYMGSKMPECGSVEQVIE